MSGPVELRATTREALARGIELFDAQQFWEAHEAWEHAWLEEEGDVRLFLHGLIQVAAGYYKATVQNQPVGCVKLLGNGLDKLRQLPEVFGGLAVRRFVGAVERTLEQARRWERGGDGLDAAGIPRLG
jgi:predicted metal-dependent hydrolase